jgi:hypothetical protein
VNAERESLFLVTVNGQPTQLDVPSETPISGIVTDAILLTENERWGGVDRWECRNSRGELLDDSTALGDVTPNERGVSVWIQLKPGVFA